MLQAGDQIGPYEIVGEIGRGGMATVYKAYHEKLDRHVAIKFMHQTFLQDDDFHARFQREARIVARLEHPSIVPIYDYSEHNGIPYLVMKYIDGMTLKRKAIKTGLTLEETANILQDVADALDYAHDNGVLHRDMKPSNILIDRDGRPYITDFGLARIADAGSSTISHDMLLGTPYYISPEQAQGMTDLDSRADIYSLGVMLYELVAGRVPFSADTPYAIVHSHIHSPVVPPSEHNDELSPEIDDVLDVALAKDRKDRYPTARALIDAYIAALQAPNETPEKRKLIDSDVQVRPLEMTPIPQEPKAPAAAAPAQPRIEAPQNRAQQEGRYIEREFDLADIKWRELGSQVRNGMASLAEMIEERIDTELESRRGYGLQTPEEAEARRQVRKRLKARQEFVGHIGTYLAVNGVLVFIWMLNGGFFWPIFSIVFWGMGVVAQGAEYYNKHGAGASRREEWFEQEVQRELQRRGSSAISTDKSKKADKAKRSRLEDLDIAGGGVRLNEDGELTDSFIEEKQRGRR